ncbi:MAG: protein kinase [Planctomycetes bacterium]|nr:protein kinase [Planctomycetota bacterium]
MPGTRVFPRPAQGEHRSGRSIDAELAELIAGRSACDPAGMVGAQLQNLGPYRLREVLGHGGMGIVYRAIGPDGTEVALKVLSEHVVDNPVIQRRFLREAQVASSVRSPHLVGCLGMGVDQGRRFIVLELMRGGNAEELVEASGGAIGELRTAAICRDAAIGLEAVHAASLIHRDIKPANLFLTEDGRAKLGDFGIVRRNSRQSDRLTAEHSALGTLGFMAPEQFRASECIDIRADIYALGATLFFLLTGRMPFFGDTPAKVVAQLLATGLPDPRAIRSDCSSRIAAVVASAGALNPDDRYQSPRELREDLELVLRDRPPRHVRATARETTEVLRCARLPGSATFADPPGGTLSSEALRDPAAQHRSRAQTCDAVREALELLDRFERGGQVEHPAMAAIADCLAPSLRSGALADQRFALAMITTLEVLARRLGALQHHINASSLRTLRHGLVAVAAVVGQRQPAPDLERALALVVDDDLVSRKTMWQALRKVGVNAESAASGAEALVALEQKDFAIVLSDVLMGDMNGFQFAIRVRSGRRCPRVPIIFVTMLAEFDKVFRATADGADDAIAKPFLLTELAAKVLCHLACPRTPARMIDPAPA